MPAKPGPTPETKAVCSGWGAPCGGGRRPTSTTNMMDRWTQGREGWGRSACPGRGLHTFLGPENV